MKKIILMTLALCMMLGLVACGEAPATTAKPPVTTPSTTVTPPTTVAPPTTGVQQPTTVTPPPTTTVPLPPHTHEADTWIVDKDNHWMECECGEMVNVAAHFIEDDICVTCGAEIYVMSDGSASVRVYNDYFDCIIYQEYDATGALIVDEFNEYTYDEEGNLLTEKSYSFGEISYEAEYVMVNEDGLFDVSKETIYEEDGSKYYLEYDKMGTNTLQICYDADGKVTQTLRYENSYDDHDNLMNQKCFNGDKLLWETQYGVIVEDDMSWTYLKKEITYYDDGTMVVYEYSEEGDVVSEGYYDADGKLIDSSSKFNAAACAPLFGTWEGVLEIDGEAMGVPELSGAALRFHLRFQFDDKGVMKFSMTIDRQDIIDYMVDVLYAAAEAEGLNKDQADDMFLQQFDMTVAEYAAYIVDSSEMTEQFHVEVQNVYYVADNTLYTGSSWTSYMEPAQFLLEGNTLNFHFTEEDTESFEMNITLTKVDN